MLASCHYKGTIPSCSDMLIISLVIPAMMGKARGKEEEEEEEESGMLNTCASGVLIYSHVYFSILGGIPSTPGDLFSFVLILLLATASGVTTNCPNASPTGPLNFVSNILLTSCIRIETLTVCDFKCFANLCSKFRLDFRTSCVVSFNACCKHRNMYTFPYVYKPAA